MDRAARATGIANRVTFSELPINFSPDPALDVLRARLLELCWAVTPRDAIPANKHWTVPYELYILSS